MDLQGLLGTEYKDGMTIDEINAALTSKEFIAKDVLDGYIPKDTADKYSSEAAEWKRKYNAQLSDDEKRKIEQVEQAAKLQSDYETLLKETTTAKHKAKFLGLGYDEKLAEQTAQALVDGNMDAVFSSQAVFAENIRSKTKADLLRETPIPPAGAATTDNVLAQPPARSFDEIMKES
ncbi:MAG: hypothetical protein RSE10_07730 [Oscillospiraceae bacterium]